MKHHAPTFAERFHAAAPLQTHIDDPNWWLTVESHVYADSGRNWGKYMSRMSALAMAIATSPKALTSMPAVEVRHAYTDEGFLNGLTKRLQDLQAIIDSDVGGFDMSAYREHQRTCKRCGELLLVSFKQTRSADEGMTMVVLPCPKCG